MARFFAAFSAAEHERFLEGLPLMHGSNWEALAERVGGGRSVDDVKMHAYRYLLVLQAHVPRNAIQVAAAAEGTVQRLRPWTFEDDALFESALAMVAENDADRWSKVAALLPRRSLHAADLQRRYEELFVDVLKIELGEIITTAHLFSSNTGIC